MPVKLQTTVKVPHCSKKLDINSVLCGIGSCFSQNILQRFFDCGFKGAHNPHGIVYNAVSIQHALQAVADDYTFTEEDFFQHNGLWHSWQHHGSFSSKTISEAVQLVNESNMTYRKYLKKCNAFIMTPSSSVVYELSATGSIVANCHKVPNNQFNRRVLSVEENYHALVESIACVRQLNPTCLIIITLSPIRHYPGDLLLNSRSKANLLAAIGQYLPEHPDISYFPSYEIVLDELRDYRYYAEDLLHISNIAETIIFERFIEACFEKSTMHQIRLAQKKVKADMHITLH